MADLNHLLTAAAAGDPNAARDLLPLVYDELRNLAAARMAAEGPNHSLNATALVHEAYLRLAGPAGERRFAGRGHFFAAAAEAMRRILVDAARRKAAAKRGGDQQRVPLEVADVATGRPDVEVLAVHDALGELDRVDARAARLVSLRYFAGFTLDEAADALGISPRTADGVCSYARAWLLVRLGDG